MSMKRTKQRGTSSGRAKDTDLDFWAKPKEAEKSWQEQIEGQPDEGFIPYKLAGRYAKGQIVMHPKFGKGIVVEADAYRVEVLFQDGRKKLGHGQA